MHLGVEQRREEYSRSEVSKLMEETGGTLPSSVMSGNRPRAMTAPAACWVWRSWAACRTRDARLELSRSADGRDCGDCPAGVGDPDNGALQDRISRDQQRSW